MRAAVVGVVLMAFALNACASTGPKKPRRDRNLISLEEIQESEQFGNALEVVRALRPTWLRQRGPNSIMSPTPIMVYVDGIRLGGPETLQSVPRLAIRDIRFLDGAAAQARFGLNNTSGAIVLRTRTG